eukprot:CAMPEP_0183407784 /NCGR_PEP_ID=MMETSP0370-20130417/17607_1 /TAXON_ID=268820 /ORGANISM="Peridinium aciculiferum, Strain PAER-2" /LENGTH=109 /DNA_ID=CAMNT_0025590193 /DNA_START=46 /DNA_END=375 /DNA_ORIENTATION=-
MTQSILAVEEAEDAVHRMDSEESSLRSPKMMRSSLSQRDLGDGSIGRDDRKDQHGNMIQMGSKKHRASFKDTQKVGAIHDVQEITAYKNNMGTLEAAEPKAQGCACAVM